MHNCITLCCCFANNFCVSKTTGGFADTEIISETAAECDAVVHIGASHDEEMEKLDTNFILAVEEAFKDTGKVFVTTSASVVYNDTKGVPRDESEPIENPHPLRAWRARHDLQVVAMSENGIRGASVRPWSYASSSNAIL